jgi:hypothetical protein
MVLPVLQTVTTFAFFAHSGERWAGTDHYTHVNRVAQNVFQEKVPSRVPEHVLSAMARWIHVVLLL